MLQIPFAFEIECERPNELCMAELSFACSDIFMPFVFKTVEWQFGWTNEWPNGNSNDLHY